MYNKDSDSLNAGAPDITITGNQDPNTQMASYGYDDAMAESRQAYDDARKKGIIPFDMEFEEFLELMQDSKRAPQQNSGIMAAAPTGTYTQNRKNNMMAYGGIAGADGRKKYGIGSFFQKAKDKFVDDIIPNEIKENPMLTAALVGGGINQFGIPGMDGAGQNWLGKLLGAAIPGDAAIDTVFGKEGVGYTLPELIQGMPGQGTGIAGMDDAGLNPNWAAKLAADVASGTLSAANLPDSLKGIVAQQINKQIPGLNLQTPDQAQAGFDYKKLAIPLSIGAGVGKYVSGLPKDELPMDTTSIDPAAIAAAARGTDAQGIAAGLRFLPEQVTRAASGGRMGYADAGDVDPEYNGWKKVYETNPDLAKMHDNHPKYLERYESEGKAQGGRIGAQEGGLMNLGGMEKDYRNEGGFVALGGEEKADDVPARLSKNEFVFTADAVRNAGGGDIDKGAEIMENLMNNLEGARGMFANAQKLKNRIV